MEIASKKSVLEMAMGGIAEVIDPEVDRVICNVMDPSTKPTAKRKIVLTMTFEPDEFRRRLEAGSQTPHCRLAHRRAGGGSGARPRGDRDLRRALCLTW